MATKTYAGKQIEITDEGYMADSSLWTREIAAALAEEEGLALNEKHYALLEYIRAKTKAGETLTIRAVGKSGIVDIKGFYELFPGAPLRKACKIGGLPKPTSCV